MGNKLYRVSETQFKDVLETLKKEREVVESTEQINEAGVDDNIFEAELGYMEIDVTDMGEFKETIFKMVPSNYDVDLRYGKAKVRYGISLEYRSYGIKNIYLSPQSVYLSGELTIDGENDSTVKDFEIEYTRDGLKMNTLSGNMEIEGNNIQIGDLPQKVEFDSKEMHSNDGVWVSALAIEQSPNLIKFIFEY